MLRCGARPTTRCWRINRGEHRLPIGVGIVGCGRISDLHELGYRGREDARNVAVCDCVKRRARRKAKAWGVDRVYTDFQELLSDPEIDVVELLVPHHLHAQMTVSACLAGKHVSIQKPMARTVTEADEMIEAAERAGVILRISEDFVFYPPHVRAKEMIEAGEIGEPYMIRIHLNRALPTQRGRYPSAHSMAPG